MNSFKPFLLAALGAATIVMTSDATPAAIKITSHTNDAWLYDADGDNLGNETFGVTADSIYAGEYDQAVTTGEIRGWIPFALTEEQRTAIASAESVTFGIYASSPTNPVGQVDLHGFNGKNSTTSSATEFHETTELLESAFATPSTPIGFITHDITAFAKAQALNNSVIAFRIQVSGVEIPTDDAVVNRYRFAAAEEGGTTYDPYIEITAPVPEPAGMVLLGLAGTLGLRRRARRM